MGRLRVADVAANVANRVIDVAVGNDKIESAIEIEIGEAAAKAESCFRGAADTGCNGDVVELSGGRRTVQSDHLVVEISDGDAGAAGIFEVTDIHAHAGTRFAVGAEGQTRFDSYVFEFSVAQIAIQLVGLSVIGDEEIGPAVLIEIQHSHTERLGTGIKNSAGGSDVFEGAVATIAEKPAGFSAVSFGRAIGFIFSVQTAKDVVFGRPVHIIADEEIEMAVAIVIEPEGRCAEGRAAGKTAGLRYVAKRAFARVHKQAILPHTGDQDVRESIVIVISDGNAHAVEFDIESRGACNVRESAVAIIFVEFQRGASALVAGP